jgi:putative flippase GtrA
MISIMEKLLASPRVRMLFVGGVSLVIAYSSFLTLISIGVHYLVASVVNFLVYLAVNFTLNKTWAFKSRGNTKKQALAHTSLHLGNQLLIMAGLWLLVEVIGIPAAWSQAIMQIVVTVVVFIVTPIIFKHK